jgi:hypothetical protein
MKAARLRASAPRRFAGTALSFAGRAIGRRSGDPGHQGHCQSATKSAGAAGVASKSLCHRCRAFSQSTAPIITSFTSPDQGLVNCRRLECNANQSRPWIGLPGKLNRFDVDVAEANASGHDTRARARHRPRDRQLRCSAHQRGFGLFRRRDMPAGVQSKIPSARK